MAGTLFVVCVPTQEHETELMEASNGNGLKSASSFTNLQKASDNLEVRLSTRSRSEESLFSSGLVSVQDAPPEEGHQPPPQQQEPQQEQQPQNTKNDRGHGGSTRREMYIGPWRVDAADLPAPSPSAHRSSRRGPRSPRRSPRSPLLDAANISRSEPEGLGALGAKLSETPSNFKKKRHRFLETELEKVLKDLGVKNAVWCRGRKNNFYQVLFSMESGAPCEEALKKLADKGIGVLLSSVVSVLPCVLYYQGSEKSSGGSVQDLHNSNCSEKEEESCNVTGGPSIKTRSEQGTWERFVQSVRARLTVAQVVEGVRANATFTFDFLLLLIIASSTAALGLLEDSVVILVASMLISPLMGPVMAATFGTMIRDAHLRRMGLVNECAGLLLGVLIGFITGLGVGFIDKPWLTEEMLDRGQLRSLWVNVLIAVLSGTGIAIALLRDNTGSLIGVAISASLLPPAVNAGLLWAMSLVYSVLKPSYPHEHHALTPDHGQMYPHYTAFYSDQPEVEMAIMGGISLCITLINIVFIYITGILMLKVKEVAPTSQSHQRFWKHDVKIARDYNTTLYGASAADILRSVVNQGPCVSGVDNCGQADNIGAPTLTPKLAQLLQLSGLPSHYGGAGFGAEHADPLPHYLDVCTQHQLTWSPSTLAAAAVADADPPADTVRELEDLYLTIHHQVHHQPLRQTGAGRRFSLSSGAQASGRPMWRLGSSDGYRCPLSRPPGVGYGHSARCRCPSRTRCGRTSAPIPDRVPDGAQQAGKVKTPPYDNMPCKQRLLLDPQAFRTPPFGVASPAAVFRTPSDQATPAPGLVDAHQASPMLPIFLTPVGDASASSTMLSMDDETAAPRTTRKQRFVVTKTDDSAMLLASDLP